MMAMTTSSSMSVNALFIFWFPMLVGVGLLSFCFEARQAFGLLV